MKQLNIDADLVAYRCAASVGDGDEEIAILRCDRLMRDLLHSTGVDHYCGFLTGKGNFRYKVNPEYKANRKELVPPKWLQECRAFLVKEWNCIVSDGCEADDLLGINQNEHSILASLDKDLLMVPGWHYNWLRNESCYVSPIKGLSHFYKQMLIGDKVDNIIGVRGIGKVKADRYIDVIEYEPEMIETVLDLYGGDVQRFYMNAQCLWIMQREGETWADRVDNSILPDQLKQEVDRMSGSTTSSMVGTLTEPTMIPETTCGTLVNGIVPDTMETQTYPLT